MRKIEIVRSATWLSSDFDNIHNILTGAIKDFVLPEDRIINIETRTDNGLSRFWIYVETA